MTITCAETTTEYIFSAKAGTDTFEYRYPKKVNGQPLDLQKYKQEVALLSNLELQKQQTPTPVTI